MTSSLCFYIWRLSVIVLGALFIFAGVYMYRNWIDIFTRLRGKEMALSPTSPAYAGWKISPLPLNFDVYLFNWTNPEDFYVGSGIKPHFEQLGPYRFREKPDKVNIVWHNHNASVSFRKMATFHFDAAGSKGTLSDRITSVNTVAHGAAVRAKNAPSLQKFMLNRLLRSYYQSAAITKTADEWIFTGYRDPLVTMGSILSLFSSNIKVPYGRVGWMYTRNDSSTYDGEFNMYTGADDINKMGQIHTWNYMNRTCYKGDCGKVRGSMGEFFPQNLTPNDSVSIYLPNLCRSVPLDYTETVNIHGVTAYKYSGTERAVDSGTTFPETKCSCVDDKCEKPGVINIGPCKFNTSIYMSYPHFYKADPSYLEAIDGLRPDKEKHEFFMTLEPNAGVPMDVGGGFQANYLLEPVQGISPFANIPRTFIPLMWAEERVRVTHDIGKDIALVPFIVLMGQIFTSILLAGGVILLCWYPTKYVTRMCHDPKSKTAILNPLASTGRTVALTSLRKTHVEDVALLGYKNGSIVRSNGTVSESLLGNTLRPANDVIIR